MNIIYNGSLISGTVQDPISLQSFPFKHGEPFTVPDHVGNALIEQSPEDWEKEETITEKK